MDRTDFTVFGATGFTGKLVCEYLAKNYNRFNGIQWSISGRNIKKLEEIKQNLLKINQEIKLNLIVASVDDLASLENLTGSTRVVLNCVGPFSVYAENIIKSCLSTRTHYMDVCGEPQFIEKMIKKYDEKAQIQKIWIINSCSFSSIPTDIACLFNLNSLQNYKNYPHLETYMKMNSSGDFIDRSTFNMSSGTWHATLDILKQPKYLIDNNSHPFSNSLSAFFKRIYHSLPYYSFILSSWVLPFPSSDQLVVLRSAQLCSELKSDEKKRIFYRNNIVLRSFFHLLSLSGIFLLFGILVHIPYIREKVYARKSDGTGPAEKLRHNDSVIIDVIARKKSDNNSPSQSSSGPSETIKRSRLTLPEIYEFTALALSESALLMIDKLDQGTVGYADGKAPHVKGGVVTPSFALGRELIEVLKPLVKFESIP